jgi:hypothetical protein
VKAGCGGHGNGNKVVCLLVVKGFDVAEFVPSGLHPGHPVRVGWALLGLWWLAFKAGEVVEYS